MTGAISAVSGTQNLYNLSSISSTGTTAGRSSTRQAFIEKLEQKIQQDLNSGTISSSELQQKLTARFGDAANGVVQSDGTVDFAKLTSLLESAKPSGSTGSGTPPSAADMVAKIKSDIDSGTITASDLQAKLTADFGDAANGIVGSDGTVDYSKLQTLLENNQPTGGPGAMGQGFGTPPSAQDVLAHIKSDIDSGKITASDLQSKLTADFGSAANGIVGSDGTVDYNKMLTLLQDNLPQAFSTTQGSQNDISGYTQQNELTSPVFVSRLV